MKQPEILSPAGTFEAMEAAVRAGADGIYFGAGVFNARMKSTGFSGGNDILSAASYCRIRGVKSYLTLNTLVGDGELADAMKLVETACEAGVNALIIQDIGLAALIRRYAPEMEIHASTQTSVQTPVGLELLKEMGFTRAVLARELSKKEIADISKKAHEIGMETELFVHGAMCMSVSGQCFMSAMLGDRSGNRGSCAQTCRLPFSGPSGSYSLSLKDMNLLNAVSEISALGIDSLKIEGRLKRPEYAAVTAAAYKAAVQNVPFSEGLQSSLEKIFSRSGFSDGYYKAKRGKEMFGIRRDEDISGSKEALSGIHSLYRLERQTVPVSAKLTAEENKPCELEITDGINTVSVLGDIPVKSITKPLDSDFVKSLISKTGGTPFYLNGFELETRGEISLAAGQINQLRRKALEALTLLREKPSPIPFSRYLPEKRKSGAEHRSLKLWGIFRSADQIENPHELDFYFIPENSPDRAFLSEKAGASIQRGLFSSYEKIYSRLSELKALGVQHILCENLDAFQMARRLGLTPHLGMGMNIYNSESALKGQVLSAESVILSPELSLNSMKRFPQQIKKGCIAYGHLPLMLTRNCPLGNCKNCSGSGFITDRKGEKFEVCCRGDCSEIHNPHPIWMADKLNTLTGLDFAVLMFTKESASQCTKIIRAYQTLGAPPQKFRRLK